MVGSVGGECFRVCRDKEGNWFVIEYLHDGATRLSAGFDDQEQAEAVADAARPMHDEVFHDGDDGPEGPGR